LGNRDPRRDDRNEHRSGASSRPVAKATDFGSDLSKSFGRDERTSAPRDREGRSDRRSDRAAGTERPWQSREGERRGSAGRGRPDRPDRSSESRSDERPSWRDRPSAPTARSAAYDRPDRPDRAADRGTPRPQREPDRGSRVREEEIGERWPEIPEWADPAELDPEVRRDLRGLSKEGAEFVGAHLFMAGMLAEEDPALAWRHARAARSKGGRVAVVRETVGLVAYRAGEWAEAIAELRAARRMSGGPGQLPVIADSERALGHPEKAIELSRSAEAADLDPSSAAEMRIVVAGARADLGQLDAALAHLEGAVQTEVNEPFSARLFYAFADLLSQADRRAEAIEWFMKAAEADQDEETDAGDRLTELADAQASKRVGDPAGDVDDDDRTVVRLAQDGPADEADPEDQADPDEADPDEADPENEADPDEADPEDQADPENEADPDDEADQEGLNNLDDPGAPDDPGALDTIASTDGPANQRTSPESGSAQSGSLFSHDEGGR